MLLPHTTSSIPCICNGILNKFLVSANFILYKMLQQIWKKYIVLYIVLNKPNRWAFILLGVVLITMKCGWTHASLRVNTLVTQPISLKLQRFPLARTSLYTMWHGYCYSEWTQVAIWEVLIPFFILKWISNLNSVNIVHQ